MTFIVFYNISATICYRQNIIVLKQIIKKYILICYNTLNKCTVRLRKQQTNVYQYV